MFLVLGATGGFGGAVTRELVARGLPVRALVRRGAGLPNGVEVVEGDASDTATLERAMLGVTTVFNGISAPPHRWDTDIRHIQDLVLTACVEHQALVIVPSTLHGVKPIIGVPLPARAPMADVLDKPTRVAQIRSELELQLEQHAEVRQARAVLLRAADWIGPGVRSGLAPELRTAIRSGAALPWYAPRSAGHSFASVTDAARIGVGIALHEDLRGLTILNVPTHFFATGDEWAEAIGRTTGKRHRLTTGIPLALRAQAMWSAEAQARLEWLRPWEAEVTLSHEETLTRLPTFTPEPIDEAIRAWLA